MSDPKVFEIESEQVLFRRDEWVFYTDGRGVRLRKEDTDNPRFLSLEDALEYAALIDEAEERADAYLAGIEERMDVLMARAL
jgi:hypothetical protein